MAVVRLYYVICDECGRPADDALGDTAKDARRLLPSGWRRVPVADSGRARIDLCPSCFAPPQGT